MERNNIINKRYVIVILSFLFLSVLCNYMMSYLSYNSLIKKDNTDFIYLISKTEIEEVETAVKYGKNIEEFYGIESILNQNKARSKMIQEVSIALPNRVILYSTNKMAKNYISEYDYIEEGYSNQPYLSVEREGRYNIIVPIKNRQEKIEAIYCITMNQDLMKEGLRSFIGQNVFHIGFALEIGAIAFIKLLKETENYLKGKKTPKKRLAIPMTHRLILIIVSVQLIISVPIIVRYSSDIAVNIEKVAQGLAKDLYHQIKQVETDKEINVKALTEKYHLREWVDNYVEDVKVFEAAGVSLDGTIPKEADFYCPQDTSNFKIWVKLSRNQIKNKYMNIIIYSLGNLLIICIGFGEIIKTIERRVNTPQCKTQIQKDVSSHFNDLQLKVFFFTSICYLPISFASIIVLGMADSGLGISCLVMGMYALGFIVTSYMTGQLQDKINWKTFLKISLVIIGISYEISAFTVNRNYFLISCLAIGMGEGIFIKSTEAFTLHEKDEEKQKVLIKGILKGRTMGMICGILLGSILFNILGRRYVYLLGIAAIIAMYIWQMGTKDVPCTLKSVGLAQRISIRERIRIWIYEGLMIVPMSILLAFIYYYIPVYIVLNKQFNFISKDLVYIFTLYGLCVLVASPIYSYLKKKLSVYKVVIGSFIGVSSILIIFSFVIHIKTDAFSFILVSAGIVALLERICEMAQIQYMEEINQKYSVTYRKSCEQFYKIRRICQIVAPIIFALGFNAKIFKSIDKTNIVGIIGVVSLGMLVAYLLYDAGKPIQE